MSAITKLKSTDTKILNFSVPSLASVDKKLIGSIKWPPEIQTLSFHPRRQVGGLYELLLRNIPEYYKVRLAYYAENKNIRVPDIMAGGGVTVKPFSSRAELLREFRRSFHVDYLKPFYRKKDWQKEMASSLAYFEKMPLDMAFRVVKNGSCVGLMMLLDWKLDGKPITLVAWVWVRKTLTAAGRRSTQRLMLAWLKRVMKHPAAAGVDGFNPASQVFFARTGFRVLRLTIARKRTSLLVSPGMMPWLDWSKTYKAAWKAVEDADYQKAMDVLTPVYKRYPRDFRVGKTYAMALGDYAETLSGERRKRLKRRSCAMLGKLVKKLGNARWRLNISTRNEYYYHTGQFRKQYGLGLEAVTGGEQGGHYGQGVGAANYAYEHALKGQSRLAALWAEKAIAAWEAFFKFKDDYYNAYVHYALALGILGRAKEMKAALKKSAKLSGKPDSYREFAEVREKISKLGESGSGLYF